MRSTPERVRRRPEATALYQIVQQHLQTFCARVAAATAGEFRALADAMGETKVDRALLVTLATAGVERADGHEVRIVPAWRWLVES